MRYKVEFEHSSISLDESEAERAWDLYRTQGGIRILLCKDIFDEGILLEGTLVVEDHTKRPWEAN